MASGDGPKGREALERLEAMFGGLFGGGGKKNGGGLGSLGDALHSFVDLAERAEALKKEGTFDAGGGRQGSYRVGFNIRTLAGEDGEREVRVEPFGDVQRDAATGEASVSEVREPPADVFEESGYVLVVVEMPGVDEGDASFEVRGDVLVVSGESESKRYAREVLLPRAFGDGAVRVKANNGVFEIRLATSESEAA